MVETQSGSFCTIAMVIVENASSPAFEFTSRMGEFLYRHDLNNIKFIGRGFNPV